MIRECLDCHRPRPHFGRHLCAACYKRRLRAGTLTARPTLMRRTTSPPPQARPALARFEDYAMLRGPDGGRLTVRHAAERVGVTVRTAWRYEACLRGQGAA
jgi:hypothetical protein